MDDVSFSLRAGEIVGIYGLMGLAGRNCLNAYSVNRNIRDGFH
ncbi:hypothetical protein P4S72_26470 [Vibrio sp. PP-XX7]